MQHSSGMAQLAMRGSNRWRGGSVSSRGRIVPGRAVASTLPNVPTPSNFSPSPSPQSEDWLPTQPEDHGMATSNPAITVNVNVDVNLASTSLSRWMNRSRSPSPVLPSMPLKRRKLSHLPGPLTPPLPPRRSLSPETPKLKTPLPGRRISSSAAAFPAFSSSLSPTPSRHPQTKMVDSSHFDTQPSEASDAKSDSFSLTSNDSATVTSQSQRRLVTGSCQFYPMPQNCKSSSEGYSGHRKAFAREKWGELKQFGLTRTRAFFRDDGLVIEWTSPVPVWSDTLLPDVPTLATQPPSIRNSKSPPPTPSESQPPSSFAQLPSSQLSHPPSTPFPTPSLPPSQPSSQKQKRRAPKPKLQHWASGLTVEQADKLLRSQRAAEEGPLIPPCERNPPIPSNKAWYEKKMAKERQKSREKERAASTGGETRSLASTPLSTPSPRKRVPLPGRNGRSSASLTPSPAKKVATVAVRRETESMCSDTDAHWEPDPDSSMVDPVGLTDSTQQLPSVCRGDSQIEVEDMLDDSTNDVEQQATDFLQRYLQCFDSDRSQLENAYTPDALFSCRVHHLSEPSFSMAGLFAPEKRSFFNRGRSCTATIEQGRRQVMDRLLTMGPYEFCPRGVPRTVKYDFALVEDVGMASSPTPSNCKTNLSTSAHSPCQGSGDRRCILLTVHGEVVHANITSPELDHVLTVDQSFVLRARKREDTEQAEKDRGQRSSSPLLHRSRSILGVGGTELIPDDDFEHLDLVYPSATSSTPSSTSNPTSTNPHFSSLSSLPPMDLESLLLPSDTPEKQYSDLATEWPLVALSHQMTVRQAPLLNVEKLSEIVPWVGDILEG